MVSNVKTRISCFSIKFIKLNNLMHYIYIYLNSHCGVKEFFFYDEYLWNIFVFATTPKTNGLWIVCLVYDKKIYSVYTYAAFVI